MIDPFSSHLHLFHPKRLFFKFYVLFAEAIARLLFSQTGIRFMEIRAVTKNRYDRRSDLSVTDEQLDYLIHALHDTHYLSNTVVIEVGAFCGETTILLASRTNKKIVAVDKYFAGWPMAESALKTFHENTKVFSNVILLKKTSGEAVKAWTHPKASLIFIDAQHNFVSTWFDINAWLPVLTDGGLIALHDVDSACFSGTRLAAWLASGRLELWAHVDGLIIFRIS